MKTHICVTVWIIYLDRNFWSQYKLVLKLCLCEGIPCGLNLLQFLTYHEENSQFFIFLIDLMICYQNLENVDYSVS